MKFDQVINDEIKMLFSIGAQTYFLSKEIQQPVVKNFSQKFRKSLTTIRAMITGNKNSTGQGKSQIKDVSRNKG